MRTTPILSEPARTGLAAAVASMCFGASVVATRFAVAETTPIMLAFLRYLIGSVVLLPVMWKVVRAGMPTRDRIAIAALGMIFFGVFPWTFSASLTYSPSSRVAVVLATLPLVTLIVSRLRGYDRITPNKLIGQLLAFAGLIFALRPANAAAVDTSSNVWIGDLLAFTTTLCGAFYNVFSRPYLKQYPPIQVTTLSMYGGLLFLAVVAAFSGAFASAPTFSTTGWFALVFLGTMGGAFGFGMWIWALQRSTPSRVAVFIALNPMTAIALGVLLLNEPVTTSFLIGFALVVAGIVIANRGPAEQPKPA
ncbi:MAG: DMT family transporter [Gemmatimonas sp.]